MDSNININNIIINSNNSIRSRTSSLNTPRNTTTPRSQLTGSDGISNNQNNSNNNSSGTSGNNTPRNSNTVLRTSNSNLGSILPPTTLVESNTKENINKMEPPYELDLDSSDTSSTSSGSDTSPENSPEMKSVSTNNPNISVGNIEKIMEQSPNPNPVSKSLSDLVSAVNSSPTPESPNRTQSVMSHLAHGLQRTTSKLMQIDELDDYGSDSEDENEKKPSSKKRAPEDDEPGIGIEMKELSIDQKAIEAERALSREIDMRRLKMDGWKHAAEIIYDYAGSLFVALIGTIACMILAYAFSVPTWILKDNGTIHYFDTKTVTFLISFFFIMGLALFTFVQFISVYGMKRMIETKFYMWVVGVIGLFLVVPFSMWKGNQPFWYWLGDIILLIIGYTGLCFVMGWVGKPYQSQKKRRINGLAFLGTELLVSATALIYGMFMIQLYSQFSNTAKIAWRLIVHPIYFELFMMIPVRMLVTKQMEKKGINIMHTLAVVHAQAHISTLGRMMISTINEYTLTIVSVLLLNIGKLAFRSSVHFRDRAASMVIKKVTGNDQKESKKFVRAVGLYTEMILENASIPASAFAMWAFYDVRGLFFFPYPTNNGRDVPFTLGEATINVVIQLGFAFVFDALTLYVNERYIKLPLDRAWRKMKSKWLFFYGFLIFGVATMGMVGVIWMACKLPRFLSCHSLDICSCKFVTDCADFSKTKLYNNVTSSDTSLF